MLNTEETLCGTPVTHLTKGSMKLVALKCDGCGKITNTTWSNYQQSLRLFPEREGKTFCQPCSCKEGGKKKRGRPAPAVAKANRLRRREKHASWKGGRYIDTEGYVMVHVSSESDKQGWTKYQKEHILVMEQHLQRKLKKKEVVHHIDGDKQNNDISNLFLTDPPGHRLSHVSLTLAYMLARAAKLVPARTKGTEDECWKAYRQGVLKFDKRLGVYVAHLKPRELLESPNDV